MGPLNTPILTPTFFNSHQKVHHKKTTVFLERVIILLQTVLERDCSILLYCSERVKKSAFAVNQKLSQTDKL